MTNVDPDRLAGILRLISRVRESVQGIDEVAFCTDTVLIDATAYRIQHIGEAANKLSPALRGRHPQLPWQRIIGMRNLLAHTYDYVDAAVVWETATQRLDDIEAMCRAELGE